MAPLIRTTAGRKATIFALAALILITCINGTMKDILDTIFVLEEIEKDNTEFLKNSLAMSTKYFASLSLTKGFLAMIKGVQVDLYFIKGNPGELLASVRDVVDMLWRFFGYSMASITAQITLLKFFKFFSITLLVPIGAGLLGMSIFGLKLLRKLGLLFIITGLILYVLMPYTIFSSQAVFNQFAMETSIDLEEKIGMLSITTSDISEGVTGNGNFITRKLNSLKSLMGGSVDILVTTAINQLATIMIMFVLTPLIFYGLLYMLFLQIKQQLDTMEASPDSLDGMIVNGLAHGIENLEGGIKKVTERIKLKGDTSTRPNPNPLPEPDSSTTSDSNNT